MQCSDAPYTKKLSASVTLNQLSNRTVIVATNRTAAPYEALSESKNKKIMHTLPGLGKVIRKPDAAVSDSDKRVPFPKLISLLPFRIADPVRSA
jgi:hypothetical protein